MLITSSWPEINASEGGDAAAEIGFVVDLITQIRSIRNEMNVPVAAKPELVLLNADQDKKSLVERNRPAIERLARVSAISSSETAPKQSAQGVVEGLEFALPLTGILDFDAERARLSKDIKSAEGEIKKLEGKLNNAGFMAKAPADVVEENRRRLDAEIETRDRLTLALKRLG
jgi:valyl-tRNA synthetase